MGKRGQLHELLAVEGDLKGEKEKIREEAIVAFTKKPGLFIGTVKKLTMFSDERSNEEGEERQDLTETVPRKLDYIAGSFSRYWDVRLQKESANQEARADVEVEGVVIFKDLPVSFLLGMEEELKQLRKVFDAVPTLAPGIEWQRDGTMGNDVYKMKHPMEKSKTEKKIEHKVLVPPTKEHPAQVTEWTEDKPVGKYTTISWSGMVTSLEKSTMLAKLDEMLRAFKKARQRANTQETKSIHVGKKIFDYIQKNK